MTNFARNSAPVLAKILAKIQKNSKNSKTFKKLFTGRYSEISQLKRNHEFSLASEISLVSENFSLGPHFLTSNFVSLITFSSELRFRRSWYRWKA